MCRNAGNLDEVGSQTTAVQKPFKKHRSSVRYSRNRKQKAKLQEKVRDEQGGGVELEGRGGEDRGDGMQAEVERYTNAAETRGATTCKGRAGTGKTYRGGRSSRWGMVEGRKSQQVAVEREEGERDRGSNNKNNNSATLLLLN
ncbi:hypothetical protein An16g03180 [Aspergillus niger]|uniref:Uncharacterized protein n=2 Tax=Aspergillus niger TaxID=5061 RepID=A2R7D8_ASPNC|nr:hypothetical protein An16g03180 [Aspergillus niger]CAK42816.1 hypothetical protein An16g03180 [Aspergillus niger]